MRELEALGFGFIEIGTVTPLPQVGNDKPRLFRLPEDKALINRMGFNNDGVKLITGRLNTWRNRRQATGNGQPLIIGGNIGKNKVTPNDEAWKDYEICFKELHPYVDYFVVKCKFAEYTGFERTAGKGIIEKNISSPADDQ
ncbi:MAG: hypothetical protein WDO71_16920 [Bacteroidota bacterium]